MLATGLYWLWRLIATVISAYSLGMAVYIVMSWFPDAYDSKFGRLLTRIYQPYLGWFQRFIPPILGLDLSPIPAFAVIYLVEKALDIIFINLIYR